MIDILGSCNELHLHFHDSDRYKEVLRKLDSLAEKLTELSTSLNPKERKLLQRIVDDLEALAKPDKPLD